MFLLWCSAGRHSSSAEHCFAFAIPLDVWMRAHSVSEKVPATLRFVWPIDVNEIPEKKFSRTGPVPSCGSALHSG